MGERLPNAANAVILKQKLAGYCLNLEHGDGGPKARAFRDVLGISANDWAYLRDQILAGVREASVTGRRERTLEVFVEVVGLNGAMATVKTGWEMRDGKPHLVTAFISKRRR